MSVPIVISQDGFVRIIRIARPEKKNALTAAMYAAMAKAMIDAGEDDQVRAVLFLGEPGAFSAGNDLADFLEAARRGSLGNDTLDFLRALALAGKPVVAGVDGLAVGIGTTMLLHADYVVASDRSRFIAPFTDLGIIPEAASTLIGPRLMGHARAFALLVMGRPFDARAAEAAGLVNAVVPPEALEETARAAARDIAAKPPGAVMAARRLMRGDPAEIVARIEAEALIFRERLRSEEARKAFEAFFNRK